MTLPIHVLGKCSAEGRERLFDEAGEISNSIGANASNFPFVDSDWKAATSRNAGVQKGFDLEVALWI